MIRGLSDLGILEFGGMIWGILGLWDLGFLKICGF